MNLEYLESRLSKLVKRWPKNLRNHFIEYTDTKVSNYKINNSENVYVGQLWFDFLKSISEELLINQSSQFLLDVMWAQYCLLLSLRIKDDLFDEDSKAIIMIFASEQLIQESIITYNKYFSEDKQFWEIFYKAVETSNLTVVYIDEIEQNIHSSPDKLLDEYIKVLSLFNIGFFALCRKTNKEDLFERIVQINNKISLAGQLIDDLEDMNEDLSRDRYNYVILVLLEENSKNNLDKFFIYQNIFTNILRKGIHKKIFRRIIDFLDEGKNIAVDLGFTKVIMLMEIYLQNIIRLEKRYYQNRVKTFFEIANSN